ncbi:hypothetical protein WJX72_003667 [[Myrmecia] bisecta]|uniref:Uncharacterized protein n=1 Tax=[Myrmecia] bisecta TaxID=41462 RepID=A0AAW1QQ48_9CHLO
MAGESSSRAWTDVVPQIQDPGGDLTTSSSTKCPEGLTSLVATEVKQTSVFASSSDAQAPSLSGIWNSRFADKRAAPVSQQDQAVDDAFAEKLAFAVCQLWKYMVRWGIEFGLITCGKWWYLARRDGSDFLIGRAIPWLSADPTVYAAVTFLINQTQHHPRVGHQQHYQSAQEQQESRTHGSTAAASAQRARLRDVVPETLHLKRHAMAYGASGFTVQGRIGNTSVAINLAPFASSRGQGLLREAGALLQLLPLWDHHVVA